MQPQIRTFRNTGGLGVSAGEWGAWRENNNYHYYYNNNKINQSRREGATGRPKTKRKNRNTRPGLRQARGNRFPAGGGSARRLGGARAGGGMNS